MPGGESPAIAAQRTHFARKARALVALVRDSSERLVRGPTVHENPRIGDYRHRNVGRHEEVGGKSDPAL